MRLLMDLPDILPPEDLASTVSTTIEAFRAARVVSGCCSSRTTASSGLRTSPEPTTRYSRYWGRSGKRR